VVSNALAISAVSAVLQYYLGNVYSGLSSQFGGTVSVSAKAPDIIQSQLGTGTSLQNQINLFLHQVTYNANWRNMGLPSLDANGKTQLKNPPLALDLHYLLTAYGSEDWQAEALLGYALLMLHQNPVLTRNDISTALTSISGGGGGGGGGSSNPLSSNPLSSVLGSAGLADQIELIKITPATLGREEIAWLWTALKADYRPTFPFQVSVVLIQTPANTSLAFPVLTRNISAQPMTPAQLLQVTPPAGQAVATPGQTVTVTGEFLSGASFVSLTNSRLAVQLIVTPTAVSNSSLSFVVPDDPVNFPAGIYTLKVLFTDTSGAIVQSTNSLPFAVAPVIPTPVQATVTQPSAGTLVVLTFSPYARPGQIVSLALNSSSIQAQSFETSTNALNFQFPSALPSGSQLARLLVDGVASPLTIDWTAQPPAFTGPNVTI
jgi:hypothetical protein